MAAERHTALLDVSQRVYRWSGEEWALDVPYNCRVVGVVMPDRLFDIVEIEVRSFKGPTRRLLARTGGTWRTRQYVEDDGRPLTGLNSNFVIQTPSILLAISGGRKVQSAPLWVQSEPLISAPPTRSVVQISWAGDVVPIFRDRRSSTDLLLCGILRE